MSNAEKQPSDRAQSACWISHDCAVAREHVSSVHTVLTRATIHNVVSEARVVAAVVHLPGVGLEEETESGVSQSVSINEPCTSV